MNRLAVTANAICGIMLCFFLLCPQSAFAAQTYDDIVVSVESAPAVESYHGYAECKLSIRNKSADKAHRITLFTPFAPYESTRHGDYLSRITRSLVVSPASSASVSILQPPLTIGGTDLGVVIDGQTQPGVIRVDTLSHCRNVYPMAYASYYGGRGIPLCILLSRDLRLDDFQSGVREVSRSFSFVKAESSASAWSSNWLAYSRYDGVVLSAADMQALPASVSSAMLQYVRCGGSLLVLGHWDKPADWKSKEDVFGPLRLNHIHFGICVTSENPDVTTWEKGIWEKLAKDAWGPTASELLNKTSTDISSANREFPVVPNLTMPVRGMFVLVLIFSLTVGPANLLILSRKNKKIWMLWTVPLASLLTSMTVFLYASLAEGWRGRFRGESITILDENTHLATTIAVNAFYCPLTPRNGLHFESATEVTPMGLVERWGRYGVGGTARTLDWTNDQHLATGWVAARVPAYFLLRKSAVGRERLNFTKTRDNGIAVLNGLGADIRQLWYADERGIVHSAKDIPAGATTTLTPSGASVPSTGAEGIWRTMYGSNWVKISGRIMAEPGTFLRPNCYIAVLDESVFIEHALRNLKSENSQSIVFGISRGLEDAGQSH